ncbi:hypothetical protein GUJ93_ZPchr0006g42467 [Zizania palustris]|uniref:Uncharacterized protein n=1 Tax=Zizania palustris TaxID=103762 RepID=A0A8J5SVA4_ZIZPA|nr:hypothetical protein GUJ93_ZPchr0006g42467 [Zizania palustris]
MGGDLVPTGTPTTLWLGVGRCAELDCIGAPGQTASGHRARLHRGVELDCDEHQWGRRLGKRANDRNGVKEATLGNDRWLEQAAIIIMDRGEKLNKQDR